MKTEMSNAATSQGYQGLLLPPEAGRGRKELSTHPESSAGGSSSLSLSLAPTFGIASLLKDCISCLPC